MRTVALAVVATMCACSQRTPAAAASCPATADELTRYIAALKAEQNYVFVPERVHLVAAPDLPRVVARPLGPLVALIPGEMFYETYAHLSRQDVLDHLNDLRNHGGYDLRRTAIRSGSTS